MSNSENAVSAEIYESTAHDHGVWWDAAVRHHFLPLFSFLFLFLFFYLFLFFCLSFPKGICCCPSASPRHQSLVHGP
jgi:hypothetical protein